MKRGVSALLILVVFSMLAGAWAVRASAEEINRIAPKGRHPFAVILVRFEDIPELKNPTRSDFESVVSERGKGGLYDFWKDISYGGLDLTGSKVFGWFTMKYSFAEVFDPATTKQMNDRGNWIAEARRLARENGVDLSPFHGIIAIVNGAVEDSALGVDMAANFMGEWGQVWHWCNKCQGLFFSGQKSRGVCPADGKEHSLTGSSDYHLALDLPDFPGQRNWRFCKTCKGLVFAGNGPGVCPARKEGHDYSGSGNYTLAEGEAPFPGQPKWRFCKNCKGLVFAGSGPGACPARKEGHDYSGSGKYTLIERTNKLNLNFLAHEMGHCLGLSHSWSADPEKAYGDPLDVMSGDQGQFTVPVYSAAGPGMNAPTLFRLGWMPVGRVQTLPLEQKGKSSITLAAVNHPEEDGYLMARVITPNRIYTIELRHPSGWDRGLSRAGIHLHELRTSFTAGQKGWRWCKKCRGLNFAGASACPAGDVHDPSKSGDYFLPLAGEGVAGQSGWRSCKKCQGLVFGGKGSTGKCPAGGLHAPAPIGDYALIQDDSTAQGQNNWRFCPQCQGLWFAGSTMLAVCPAGGLHDKTGSGNYTLATIDGSPPPTSRNWRWCSKCQGLFYAGRSRCPIGGMHDNSDSHDYSLPFDAPGALGQSGWKWCSACQGLGFSKNASMGKCPSGGTHDYSASGTYRLLLDAKGAAGQDNWRYCKNCQGLVFGGNDPKPGECPAGGPHDHKESGNYTLASASGDLTYSIGDNWQPGQEYRNKAGDITIHIDSIETSGQRATVTIIR